MYSILHTELCNLHTKPCERVCSQNVQCMADRDRPIMLIFLPIMLCCTAHKIYLLCSKLCSRIRIVLSLSSLFKYKFT